MIRSQLRWFCFFLYKISKTGRKLQMTMCRDVAWIHHRQTQWYESWHFAICLFPLTVFSRRFLVPLPALLPNTHTTKQSLTWEHCWAEWLSKKPSHLYAAAAGAATAHTIASAMARSQLQCQGTHSAEDTWASTTIASHWVFLLCLTSQDLHFRWLEKEKEIGIQTFQVIEGKRESLV